MVFAALKIFLLSKLKTFSLIQFYLFLILGKQKSIILFSFTGKYLGQFVNLYLTYCIGYTLLYLSLNIKIKWILLLDSRSYQVVESHEFSNDDDILINILFHSFSIGYYMENLTFLWQDRFGLNKHKPICNINCKISHRWE